MELNAFTGFKTIFENAQTHIQKAILNGSVYAIKTYKNINNFEAARERLEREKLIYELISEQPVFAFEDKGNQMLAKPFSEGITLADFINDWNFDLQKFIELSILIVEALDKVQSSQVLHLDLNPSNIIYDPAEERIAIIDFSSSSLLKDKKNYHGNPQDVECDLHYISPEQTGRIYKSVDFTSDLYSLGAVLYELATGQKLFKSLDVLKIIHNHIAKAPTNPTHINPELDKQVEKIVLKLLSKDSEDRYQSCRGLIYDLKVCQGAIAKGVKVEPFPLGKMDIKYEFRISQKHYGREAELHTMSAAYGNVAAGNKKFVLLSGSSGTGKSNLVASLHKELSRRKCIFIQGKFDQVNRNLPYSAWVEAFNNFVELIITANEAEIQVWKSKIIEKIGDRLPYLAQIVPKMHWLFDDLDEIQVEINAETQKRLRFAIKNLFETIATEEHPLIVFIDNWQWADNASIDLLRNLSEDPDLSFLYIINAYRANEKVEDHPFNIVEEHLGSLEETIHIELQNLKQKDTLRLLSDSLMRSGPEVEKLNEFIYRRTQGNAFFYVQFLNTLNNEGIFKLNNKNGKWEWDEDHIMSTNIPDDIVELMVAKIGQQGEFEQHVLQAASCIGGTFDLEVLSEVLGIKKEEIKGLLDQSISDGLVSSVSSLNIIHKNKEIRKSEYRFTHDRIQQGIYDLLPNDKKEKIHFLIGECLIQKYNTGERLQNIFSIVEQLNKGKSHLNSNVGQKDLARYNYTAGEKAKVIADFENSLKYTQTGISVLGEKSKQEHDPVYIQLLLQQYELGFMLKSDTEFEENILTVELSPYEEARFNRIKVNGLIASGRLSEACDAGLEFLDSINMGFKKKPTKLDIIVAALKTSRTYNKKKIHELFNLPVIEDPYLLEIFEIIQLVNSAAYFTDQSLWALMNIQTTRMHTKMGLCPMAGLTFNAYGAILIISSNDTTSGIAFGKLSVDIFKKFKTQRNLNKTLFGLHALIDWWENHARNAISGLDDALNLSLAAGDFTFVGHCCNVLSSYYLSCHDDIRESIHKTGQLEKLVGLSKDYTNVNSLRIRKEYFKALVDSEYALKVISENKVDIGLNIPDKDDPKILFFSYHSTMIRLHFLLEDYENAYKCVQDMLELEHNSYGTYISIYTDFFIGMTLLMYDLTSEMRDKKQVNKLVNSYIKDYKKASAKAPVNFMNKYNLLMAADALRKNKNDSALKHALKGLEFSRSSNFIVEEAIAWDLCARVYNGTGMQSMANHCIEFKYGCYKKYGATTLMTNMEKKSPWIKQNFLAQKEKSTSSSGSLGNALASIDLKTILKSSALLAAETDPTRLSTKLVEIAVENAAAERGYLILKTDNILRVKAYADVDGQREVIENDDYQSFADIAHKVLNYVNKTKQSVIISDAVNDSRFGDDPYLLRSDVKSIFALPILNKGHLAGILYLENNRTRNAFTSDRIELLKLLTGQIAVSLENAMLFDSMEEKVRKRTLEIQKERDNSEKLLLNILPKSTAVELKKTGRAEPRFYNEVSVLFLDFKNFSGLSKTLDYKQLIAQLDHYFHAFDDIIEEYHIEKIKTIGDAYMCACGLPIERKDHASLICKAALDMQEFIEKYKIENQAQGLPFFEARIGIDSGPVVAGVVGSKKFAYDIWGATVNIASRLEMVSEVGEIAVSERTYKLIKHDIECIPKGKIEAKHGEVYETYTLKKKGDK